jgi:hypothetical protein
MIDMRALRKLKLVIYGPEGNAYRIYKAFVTIGSGEL